jgi:hypothetical protein
MDQNIQQRKINIELGEIESEGIYSNLAIIAISPQEFVIDFARIMPGRAKAKVYSRIVMTPGHAKLLLKALDDNIKKYENQFGQIKILGQEEKNIGFAVDKEKG